VPSDSVGWVFTKIGLKNMFPSDDEQQKFQWRKKLLLFGGMFLVGLIAIILFTGC
jgi:hypothetical protein